MNLKPCPCGKTPSKLILTGIHNRPKYAEVTGDCCGEWMIEFYNHYSYLDTQDSMDKAIDAWNNAPRGNPK